MNATSKETMTVQQLNAKRCNRVSVAEWAGWFEGEEGWGIDDDDEVTTSS